LEQTTQPQITTSATPQENIRTITSGRAYYRQRRAMAKRLQVEEWFVAEFGSEEQWINQHYTKQPYDKEWT
jgi:hypothetical protein